ncbi:MAG: hypothetical protein NTX49_04730 [Chlamydiae bacterium]|nr:hypothetical protein [Chlamydiota bacterium]
MNPINSSSIRYQRLQDTRDQVDLESSSLQSLPLSVIERIANFSYAPADADSRISLKALSTYFRDLDLTPVRRRQWETLLAASVSGIIDIPSEMRHIERTYVHNPLNSTNQYTQYFRRLRSVFHHVHLWGNWMGPLDTTPADYALLQASLEDRQLEKCWREMKEQISKELWFFGYFYWMPGDEADAQTIRTFLEKGDVRRAILSVRCLALNNLALLSIPKEVTLFTNLKELILSHNQFLSLPTYSFVKRMSDPELPFVYNQVPAFPHLERLEIGSYNMLSASPFREVRALPSIKVFPRLTHISFDIQGLRSLASIEKRAEGSRPISNLTISLKGSKVYQYMMDKEYHPQGTYQINYDIIYRLKKYIPTSPLGQLYHQMLYTEATMIGLKELVELLPERDRNLLYYCIWKYSFPYSRRGSRPIDWGREHCFTDEHLFKRCIGLCIQEKFMQILHIDREWNFGVVNYVYQNIWEKFQRTDSFFDERWALENRFNNFARLADAMSTIGLNRIQPLTHYNHWIQ